MSLTYQPFAEVPQVDDLKEDLKMNVPDSERTLSALVGGGFIAAGATREGPLRWLLVGLGAALVHRGWTGRCAYYSTAGLDPRHRGSRAAKGSGVPGNRGTRAEHSIEVYCSSDTLYGFWRNLENLPQIMPHVQSVDQIDQVRSHWRVKGPGNRVFEWDAEIINDEDGRMLAWQTLPGSTVRHAGSVWFEPVENGATRVKVAMEFDPPAGAIGAAIAGMLGDSPQKQLEEDLTRFKEFAELELAGSPAVGP
jgi:uncharacterized membrane protein